MSILIMATVAAVAFGVVTALGVAVAYPWLRPWLARLPGRLRARIIMTVLAAPLSAALVLSTLALMPGLAALVWPALDHCTHHDDEHLHLCVVHAPTLVDLGVLDERGYLAITGRKSDMFIVGGSNAYPAEIEDALSGHPEIVQAYVVGVPDGRLGEVGFAFVQRDGAGLDEAGVKAFAKARLADFKVPRHMTFVDAWPLTPTGTGQLSAFLAKFLNA